VTRRDRSVPSLPRRIRSPIRPLLAVGLYVAVAAVTVAIVRSELGYALAGDSATALAGELAAGALLVGAALIAGPRRPAALVGWPLAAAGIAWPLMEWNSPGAGAAFTAGLALYAVWPCLLAHSALRGTDRHSLGRPAAALVAVAYVTSLVVLGVASAAVYDPLAQGCLECPRNRLLIAGDADVWHELGQVGLALSVAWIAAFVALVAAQVARSSPARRRLVAPALVPAVAAVALFGADAVHSVERGFLSNDPTDRTLWVGEMVALSLVAAGLAWERVRARRTRSALAQLVVDLGASPPPGGLQGQLAVLLGDPTLTLLHSLDDGASWIDAEGRQAALPADGGRGVTRIMAGGREVSALVHRTGLLDDPGLAQEIAGAARLGLENERLNAMRRAHLAQLRASRARIVATADAERRRLERDLHDGAQQRLVTLALSVRLARRQLAAMEPTLEAELRIAEQELRAAVGELRELAHGLFPAVLAEEGFGAALEVLSEQTPRLVPRELPEGRFAAPVESAAYFVVAESLKRTAGGDVAVDARRQDGRLVLEVASAAELAGAATELEDRVGALGGELVGDSHHMRAELPCES
jgi:signal transduction histidine kinase